MDISAIGIALFWGLVSAVSLPIGAIIGLKTSPSRTTVSALMAFGSGALLFALTIELFGLSLEHMHEHGVEVVLVTAGAGILGGLLFHFANKALNNRGAFVRNLSNTKKWLRRIKIKMNRSIIEELSENRIMVSLPPEDVAQVIPFLDQHKFKKGQVIFNEGDTGASLYLIASGKILVSKKDKASGHSEKIADLTKDDIFGEMALVTDMPRVATAEAVEDTVVFALCKKDLERVAEHSEALHKALTQVTKDRIDDLSQKNLMADEEWEERAKRSLDSAGMIITQAEIKEVSHEAANKPNAGQAIWLGLFIDGLPESLVIGLLSRQPGGISLAFVVGVFLANLPEALSGAASMANGGMSKKKIMKMWISLCVMMGLGAAIGAWIFPANPHGATLLVVAGIEGLAAGAMLTAIAESFLPEAYEQGGDIVGLTTLAGFISALMLKLV